jgi:predicted nucleic acid-binding protein
VPALWLYEVADVLTIAARRGRLSPGVVSGGARILASLPVDIAEAARDMTTVMYLAARHSLTVYDAAYLHVALQAGLDLATLDGSLGRAARDAGSSSVVVTVVPDRSSSRLTVGR